MAAWSAALNCAEQMLGTIAVAPVMAQAMAALLSLKWLRKFVAWIGGGKKWLFIFVLLTDGVYCSWSHTGFPYDGMIIP